MRVRANKWCKGLAASLAACMLAGIHSSSAAASDYELGYNTDASENDCVFTIKSPKGIIGKSMSIPFRIRATNEDVRNLRISLLQTSGLQQIKERGNGDHSVDYYPFEITKTTFAVRSVGTIREGNVENVSLSARMRWDTLQGHYNIPVLLERDGGSDIDYINIWIPISSTSGADGEEDKRKNSHFVVGENQPTPRGVYPDAMDYTINLRNERETTTQDVTAGMQLSEDDARFPFEISDGNCDRTFERAQPGETVLAPYSMAIRRDSYAGYCPIKYIIIFRLSSEGDLRTKEGAFYIHTVPKDKEDDLGDFNVNDRTRTRLIVESYHTVPKKIYAGDGLELVPNMKNTPTPVPTSNILFNLEPERISGSAVFTTEPGTSSLVVDNMAPGQTTEVRVRFTARTRMDQRSYVITVKEEYDNPEFKNAEESITVDIPVKQYVRLGTSTANVMPDSLIVGFESNVMSGINNMGKVTLYNVTVTFETDSIKTTDAYMGNTKPDEMGNVDTTLTGVVPILDEGTVCIRIGYEDENGVPVGPVEREPTLMVTGEMERNRGDVKTAVDVGNMDAEAALSFWSKYKFLVIAGVMVAAGIAAAIVIRIRKKRKAAREKDAGDEISRSRNHGH